MITRFTASGTKLMARPVYLQQPEVPVLVHQQVKAKELEAVGQREEAELSADRLQALACTRHNALSLSGACLAST